MVTRFLSKIGICLALGIGCLEMSALAQSPALLVLNSALTSELNRVLKAGDSLHNSLVTQDEDQIELDLHHLLWQLTKAREASAKVKPHENLHLMLILDSAQREFEQTRSLYGEERRGRLERGYDQIANLVRIYRLDRMYAIYYCPDDNTSWVQKGRQGQKGFNPFRPKAHRDCGIRVERQP